MSLQAAYAFDDVWERQLGSIQQMLTGEQGPVELFVRQRPGRIARGSQSVTSAMRLAISSGETSSMCVATLHRCPNGSSNWPVRSP